MGFEARARISGSPIEDATYPPLPTPAPCTLHLSPCTLHLRPCTLHPALSGDTTPCRMAGATLHCRVRSSYTGLYPQRHRHSRGVG